MACGACASKRSSIKWIHTAPDGTKKEYGTEVEANAAKARRGGTVKPK